jgi:hypothetical protein
MDAESLGPSFVTKENIYILVFMTHSIDVIGNVVTCNCGKLAFHVLIVKILFYGIQDSMVEWGCSPGCRWQGNKLVLNSVEKNPFS